MNSKQLACRVKPIKRIKKSSSVGELVIDLPHSLYISNIYIYQFYNNLKWKNSNINQFEKIHRSTFQYIEDISIVFIRRIWRQPVRKNVRQEHGLFTQNKCLSRISSFLQKNRHRWRLNNSSKTFLNQWESMGFRKL